MLVCTGMPTFRIAWCWGGYDSALPASFSSLRLAVAPGFKVSALFVSLSMGGRMILKGAWSGLPRNSRHRSTCTGVQRSE